MKRSLALAALLLAGSSPLAAQPAQPVAVVATFSILGDLTAAIGGDDVAVTNLVGPDGDAHAYEPTPSDVRALAAADVLVTNGVDFEPWLAALVSASGFDGRIVIASEGLEPHAIGEAGHDHGGAESAGEALDPHLWQDVSNAVTYAATIAGGLAAADPGNAADYAARGAAYEAELAALDTRIRQLFADIPPERRIVVTSHDAFGYFGEAYGVTFLAPEGVATEAEPTATDVAAIIRQIRADNVTALFVENITDPRIIQQISAETGVAVGGTLYSDALSAADGPAATYVAMMEWNAAAIAEALAPR
ncbi:MAG: metal ABC transporter solute-binding protein, Zn/Mn family [Bauldia sp.]